MVLSNQHEGDGCEGGVPDPRTRRQEVDQHDAPREHHQCHGDGEGEHACEVGGHVAVAGDEALNEHGVCGARYTV